MDDKTSWQVATCVVSLRLPRILERARLEMLQESLWRSRARRAVAARKFKATLLEHKRQP